MQFRVYVLALPWLAMGAVSPAHAQTSTVPIETPGASFAQGNLTPNRGWEGLATMLDSLTPSIDTGEKQSGEQIALQIEQLINRDQAQKALELIQAREAKLARSAAPGNDVQLMFQKARALAALQQTKPAQEIYEHMTLRYPELPEPWNNLAVIYVQQGQLGKAEQALKNAVMNNPDNADTQANLADVQLLMKLHESRKAVQRGEPGAAQRLQSLETLLGSK